MVTIIEKKAGGYLPGRGFLAGLNTDPPGKNSDHCNTKGARMINK